MELLAAYIIADALMYVTGHRSYLFTAKKDYEQRIIQKLRGEAPNEQKQNEQSRNIVAAVNCTYCGMPAGTPCKTERGAKATRCHWERVALFEDM